MGDVVIDVAIVIAGALGALARFVLDTTRARRAGDAFPVGILSVNVSGALVLGALTGLGARHGLAPDVLAVLGIGFCGGYTTYSTFAFDTIAALRQGRLAIATAYPLLTVTGSVGAAVLGLVLSGAW